MIFLQPSWLVAFVCACTFFGAGGIEARDGARDNRILWFGLSIALSAAVIQLCGGGWLFVILAQAGLFVAIGVIRAVRDSKSSAGRSRDP